MYLSLSPGSLPRTLNITDELWSYRGVELRWPISVVDDRVPLAGGSRAAILRNATREHGGSCNSVEG